VDLLTELEPRVQTVHYLLVVVEAQAVFTVEVEEAVATTAVVAVVPIPTAPVMMREPVVADLPMLIRSTPQMWRTAQV
jgi:hypothetical protein